MHMLSVTNGIQLSSEKNNLSIIFELSNVNLRKQETE